MTPIPTIIESASVAETLAIGRRIGSALRGGEAIALIGGLGAGKTQFVKGLAAGVGVGDPSMVTSPTFVLVNEYAGPVYLYHIDAYRLSGPAELEAIGVEEMFTAASAVVVEWADRVLGVFPEDVLTARFDVTDTTRRRITLVSAGPQSAALVAAVTA